MSDSSNNKISLVNLPNLPDSVDQALTNLTDQPTKSVGQTLSDCWYLVFGGISQAAEKRRAKYAHELTIFKNELEDSLSTVPDEVRQEPSSQIVMQALEQAKYCVEEPELRKMFVSLLTSSIDSTKYVHPSFASILSHMSPTDARIFEIFKRSPQYATCDLKHIADSSGAFQTLETNLFISGPSSISQTEQSISISSLIHLGLLEIPFDLHIISESVYNAFKSSDAYLNALKNYPETELDIDKKIVRLTRLGRQFMSCCLSSP